MTEERRQGREAAAFRDLCASGIGASRFRSGALLTLCAQGGDQLVSEVAAESFLEPA